MGTRSRGLIPRLRGWARALKRQVALVWLAAQHPDVPWSAKLICAATAAYALSPIDLIPDFIPVLGLLDDLLIVPAGLWLALRLIAPETRAELEIAAETATLPVSRGAAVMVVIAWLLAGIWLWRWLSR